MPVVSVAVYYDVGSRNEKEGRTGFAHLFEHMMFQGSENVPKAAHFQYIFNAGADHNDTTVR
jgi:predicted Zn-dependent peptidase